MKKKSILVSVMLISLLLILILGMSVTVSAEEDAYSGQCGYNLTWSFDPSTDILTISGSGSMYGYWWNDLPDWNKYASQITEIKIEEGVTSVDDYVFRGCSKVKSVTIPSTLNYIGAAAFDSCSSLENVYISDLAAWCSVRFYNYTGYSSPLRYADNLYLNGELLVDVEIPNTISKIAPYSLSCSNIKSVIIPESITEIGESAFSNCESLSSVFIPNLSMWYKIKFDTTSSNPLYNEADLYINNELLTELYFDDVSSIGSAVFSGCTSLVDVTIGTEVTRIGPSAFSGCQNLANVTIGNSVTSIGDSAFYNCSGLTSITIPDSVTTIGTSAFEYCTSLTSVTIGDSVTSIGEWAFYDCDALKSVTIPDSVTSIGERAFYYCYSLTDIHYHGTAQDKASISIGADNSDLDYATWHYYDNGCDVTCSHCSVTREPLHSYTNACDRDCNTCGITRVAPHKYDGVCDGECNLCGFRRKAEAHTYDGVCDGVCNGCALKREAESHTYDNACDGACNGCGLQRVPAAHVYGSTCDADCDVCGAVRQVEHTYDNACDATCNVCGFIRSASNHVYDNACDTTCNECGFVREAADHVYSDVCDIDCNNCREKREPIHDYDDCLDDTCDTCGWYREPMEHTYSNDYDVDCDECGAIREVSIPTTFSGNSVSEDVSGLAFRFDVVCEGMEQKITTAIYDNATVDGYKLLSMGAVVTNGVESADIPAVYLYELKEDTATFAVRIIEIPPNGYNTDVTATPYIVLEIDGVATTIYGEAQTCSYNDVKN